MRGYYYSMVEQSVMTTLVITPLNRSVEQWGAHISTFHGHLIRGDLCTVLCKAESLLDWTMLSAVPVTGISVPSRQLPNASMKRMYF